MSKNEQQPARDPKTDSAQEGSFEIDPHKMGTLEIRRIIANAMFSSTTETNIIFEYPHTIDEITPKQLRTVRRGSLEDIDQFITDKTNEMLYSDRIVVEIRKLPPSDNSTSA